MSPPAARSPGPKHNGLCQHHASIAEPCPHSSTIPRRVKPQRATMAPTHSTPIAARFPCVRNSARPSRNTYWTSNTARLPMHRRTISTPVPVVAPAQHETSQACVLRPTSTPRRMPRASVSSASQKRRSDSAEPPCLPPPNRFLSAPFRFSPPQIPLPCRSLARLPVSSSRGAARSIRRRRPRSLWINRPGGITEPQTAGQPARYALASPERRNSPSFQTPRTHATQPQHALSPD